LQNFNHGLQKNFANKVSPKKLPQYYKTSKIQLSTGGDLKQNSLCCNQTPFLTFKSVDQTLKKTHQKCRGSSGL